jgi:outer membrane protein OmpA-like peptidoglycan-associated protein
MKVILTGFMIFVLWAIPCRYWYVCKIKEACSVSETSALIPPSSKEKQITQPEIKKTDETEAVKETTPEPVVKAPEMVAGDLLFGVGSAAFRPDQGFNTYAQELKTYLSKNPQIKLRITGHTDNTGNPDINTQLGYDRARAVDQYLKSAGITNPIETFSAGSSEPLADNSTADGRARNRRVQISLTE